MRKEATPTRRGGFFFCITRVRLIQCLVLLIRFVTDELLSIYLNSRFTAMRNLLTTICLMAFLNVGFGQELPFRSIAETERTYSAGNIAARMVEGLGFRYYWATEGLRTTDLAFEPVEKGRSSKETFNHLHTLSGFLLSALEKEVFVAGNSAELSFDQIRKETLQNLEKVVNILKASKDTDFKDYNIRYANGGQLPFWNVINGPIADAIYHTGQVVLMRRMSGNPMDSKVNVLAGVRN